ncbi:MAG TPA: glycerophosphodiester phosphodiesterase family protein [Actinocatenispora sp.]
MSEFPVRVIGHRGVVGSEPENTLRSFVRAETVGADEIELDIRVSADGHLVVVHDATVDRTTSGTGEVAGLTLAELRALDAGLGEHVPTYEEVLAAVALPIQTEIKVLSAVRPFAELVRRLGVAERVTAASHSAEIVAAVRDELPEVPRTLILPRSPADSVDQARAVGATWLALGLADLTEALVDKVHDAGIRIDAWPVGDADRLARAVSLGVYSVTTDHADQIRTWL